MKMLNDSDSSGDEMIEVRKTVKFEESDDKPKRRGRPAGLKVTQVNDENMQPKKSLKNEKVVKRKRQPSSEDADSSEGSSDDPGFDHLDKPKERGIARVGIATRSRYSEEAAAITMAKQK